MERAREREIQEERKREREKERKKVSRNDLCDGGDLLVHLKQ
jgi:hypothetical protein